MILALPFFCLLAAASGAAPDSAAMPDSVLLLPEVRVERERPLSEARRRLPTAFVSDLRTGASGRAFESLAEVLTEAAGVHVDQYGGLGAFSALSLRGAPAGQVTVFLDGAPLTSAAHGTVNLADLPATAIERIEVYRGLAPLGLGVATPGGAVNLVTSSRPGRTDLRVARGSFGTWEGRGSASARRGHLTALLHAGYQGSAGDFRWRDDNGTPLEPADDSTVARVNNRFDAATAIGTLVWEPRAGLRVLAREDLFRRAQGDPGVGAIVVRNARLALARSLTYLDARWAAAGWIPALDARASTDHERTRDRDTGGELGMGYHDSDDRLRSDDLGVGLEWPAPASWLTISGAGELRRERAELHDAADGYPDPPTSRRLTRGASAGVRLRLPGDWLVLHAARRWDRLEDRLASLGVAGTLVRSEVSRTLDTPQLGARLAGRFGLEARANWTRAQRAPTFDELFGRAGSILGEPTLKPERAENWDAGLGWSGALALLARSAGVPLPRGARASVLWAHFESHAEDLVAYERLYQFVRPRNISRARLRGEELSLELSAGPLTAASSFTWQTTVDQSPFPFRYGTQLPLRPARQAFGRVAWRAGPRSAWCPLRLGATLQYLGDNYLNPGNRAPVPSRTIAGVSLALTPRGSHLTLTVEGKNLGDNRIVDVGGYPLPGRSLFVSLAYGETVGALQP